MSGSSSPEPENKTTDFQSPIFYHLRRPILIPGQLILFLVSSHDGKVLLSKPPHEIVFQEFRTLRSAHALILNMRTEPMILQNVWSRKMKATIRALDIKCEFCEAHLLVD
jgi:hypothetical protein